MIKEIRDIGGIDVKDYRFLLVSQCSSQIGLEFTYPSTSNVKYRPFFHRVRNIVELRIYLALIRGLRRSSYKVNRGSVLRGLQSGSR